MKYLIHSAAFTGVLFITGISRTQAQVDLTRWQIGVNGGIFVYQGDLTPSDIGSYRTAKPTVGLYISRILNPSFLLRTNLAFGKLYGDDTRYNTPAFRLQRNYSFTTPVTEISELLVWNMFGNNGNELGQRFSPYLFGGLGVSFLNIKRDYTKASFAVGNQYSQQPYCRYQPHTTPCDTCLSNGNRNGVLPYAKIIINSRNQFPVHLYRLP